MSFEEWYDQHFGSADPNVVKPGNIDLGNRPPVYNPDGTVSTEKSFSISDKYGREILLPQVVDGKMLSKKDAIQHYRDTGEHLGIYKDIPTANTYAESIHKRGERLDYAPGNPIERGVGSVMQSVRDAPAWVANRIYQGATKTLPPPPYDPYGFSLSRATQNLIDMTGEGPSAREQEAAVSPPGLNPVAQWQQQHPEFGPYQSSPPPPPIRPSWLPTNQDLYNQLKRGVEGYKSDIQNILPPGFSVQRGLNSALGPAKWLFNEIRQGVLPDEALQEIKRDPYSPASLAAYAQAGIALSGGKGGPGELGPRGAVPEHIWQSWKIPNPDQPTIRVDNAGNHFEMVGIHKVGEPGEPGHNWHAIVKPIEAPGTPEDYWAKYHENMAKPEPPPSIGDDFPEMPPGVKPGEYWKPTEPPPTQEQQWKDFAKMSPDEYLKKYPKPLKPEPGSVMDAWSKKHGGQVPDFGGEPPLKNEPWSLDEVLKQFPEQPQTDPLDSVISDWDEAGMDVPPPTPEIPKDPRTHMYWSDTYQKMMPFDWGTPPDRWTYKPPPPE